MSGTPVYGQAAVIDQIPTPAATVAIASSTNASPTVITTSTAHGLHTGQVAIIYGHATNTNANGVWIVAVVSSTTFRISTFAGVLINGNGVGGATGTVQSLGLPGVTLPQDSADDMDASSVNVPFEALLDMTAWLTWRQFAKAEILKGGEWRLKAGASGTVEAGAELFIKAGALTLDTDGTFGPTFTLLNGTIALRSPQRFGDADNTVNVSSGHEVILSTAPTTARTSTLIAPIRDGLFVDYNLQASGNNGGTKYFEIKRSGSVNYICRLSGWSTDLATNLGSGRVRVIADGGVWRLAGGVGYLMGADA